jgi:hypothetical protein
MHLIKAQGDIERCCAGLLVLPAQVIEQLIGRDGQVANTALEEIPGECGFRCDHQIGRLGPARHLPEQGAYPAEILLVRTFLRPYLGYSEAEHA